MECNLPKQNGNELLMCKVAPKSSELAALVNGKGHDLRKDHPNDNTFKVQDTRFNKTRLVEGDKKIGGGGGGDGGPNTILRLLHQSNSNSKLIFQIAKKLTVIEFATTMNKQG